MTDREFDVLDELYFVVSFQDLQEQTDLGEEELRHTLSSLVAKEWVKCFKAIDVEVPRQEFDFKAHYSKYYYLATKKGLFAHNSQ